MKRLFLRLSTIAIISALAGCVVAPAPDRGTVYYQRSTPYEEPPSTYYYYQPAPRVEYVGPPLWPTLLWFGTAWHWSEHRHSGRSYYRGGGRRH